MRNEFTAVFEKDEKWWTAWCPEISGAVGQGKTKEESLEDLRAAVALILEDRREDMLRGVPEETEQEVFTV